MNDSLDGTLKIIRKELDTAESAARAGNHGMARVCARRAAGAAIAFWLQSNSRSGWGIDTMNRLRSLQQDDSTPLAVQEAASRLTSKVTPQFTSPHSSNPVDDSRIIIDHILGFSKVNKQPGT